jgi:hypothetical protein
MHPYRHVLLYTQMKTIEGLLASLGRELVAGGEAHEDLPAIIGGCIDNARVMVSQARSELDDYVRGAVPR